MSSKSFDIIIFGAGNIGIISALILAKSNYKIALIDKENYDHLAKKDEKRAYAISAGSKKFLENHNIWQFFQHDDLCPIDKIHVIEGFSDNFFEFKKPNINSPLGIMVNSKKILANLYKAAKSQKNITIFDNFNCQEIEYKSEYIAINSDKIKINSKLLIAADGRNSFIRNYLNIKTYEHDYEQTALVGTISHDNNHNNIALERFLHNGPFACLPLASQNTTSIVWTEEINEAAKIINSKKSEIEAILATKSVEYMKKPQIIGELKAYPLNLIYAKQNIFHRTILIGDAAHGIHPLAGQGFNLSIRDIEDFLTLIKQKSLMQILDPGCNEIVKEFSKMRKFDIFSLISVTHGLNQLFSNNLKSLSFARNYGIKATNSLGFLKNKMQKFASGL